MPAKILDRKAIKKQISADLSGVQTDRNELASHSVMKSLRLELNFSKSQCSRSAAINQLSGITKTETLKIPGPLCGESVILVAEKRRKSWRK